MLEGTAGYTTLPGVVGVGFRLKQDMRREAEDRSSIVTQWFAPDVGLVKWQVARPTKPRVVWVLEKYELRFE